MPWVAPHEICERWVQVEQCGPPHQNAYYTHARGGPSDCRRSNWLREVRARMLCGKLCGICMIFHRQALSFFKTLDLVASSVLLSHELFSPKDVCSCRENEEREGAFVCLKV
jgi:hypothetical protein